AATVGGDETEFGAAAHRAADREGTGGPQRADVDGGRPVRSLLLQEPQPVRRAEVRRPEVEAGGRSRQVRESIVVRSEREVVHREADADRERVAELIGAGDAVGGETERQVTGERLDAIERPRRREADVVEDALRREPGA